MPVPPQREQNGRTPVPVPTRDHLVRDAEYAQWHFEQTSDFLTTNSATREAFRAGWDARERTVNQEPEKLDEGSLFPTMGLHRDL